ncbi:MAG: NADH-quinone oxidoreductase subunit L [Acidobacteriaceae bacterium]|nr:NADH-quinone oxidoreductase subunit L [Acidobacteriaceae bacterium]MBV9781618.1 NADH-quinone oxidoreductase subunit L [Acidobacteriaceae bacterium]
MLSLLWLIPAIPFASAAVLALFGSRLSRRAAGCLGAGSIGISALVAILAAVEFLVSTPPGNATTQHLWTWMSVGGFRPGLGLYFDPVALVMVLVVTFVGFLIHLYSVEYMRDDDGFSRFFAYMNLFVAAMLTLVLANNLLLLYLGWEGVGLCSFLLIGFWYRDPANVRAANKAFLVTRIGDTAMAIGLFLIATQLGTLDIQEAMHRATAQWSAGSAIAIATAALLLGGAVGKSAQLPLQTWLPDAMAGPTPTSALIHAATMVTAGVYLIARTSALFTLAPPVQFAVALIGATTMLLSAFSAMAQRDLKRVLAYSTMSQIGYMFLALGLGAWSAAIFHLMTHAFFKALLFLAAGVVIQAMHHDQDMFHMGGLRFELPVAFWSFVIGGSALAGLPLITAGFFSKDLILWQAWAGPNGNGWFWIIGLFGAALTSFYTYRMILLVFFGPEKEDLAYKPGPVAAIPLVVLCVFSIIGGYVDTPPDFGGVPALSNFLNSILPPLNEVHIGPITEVITAICASAAFAIGLAFAYLIYGPWRARTAAPREDLLLRLWYSGFGFDKLYEILFVTPFQFVARRSSSDVIDHIYTGIAKLADLGSRGLRHAQNGRVRWYATGVAAGFIVLFAVALLGSLILWG